MTKLLSEHSFRELFSKGKLPPVSLWIGEEDFLKFEALAFLRMEAPKQGLDVEMFSAGEVSPSEVVGRAATPSILGGRTLLVLTEAERSGSSERAFLKRYAEGPLPEVALILVVSSGVDSQEDIIQSLAQRAAVVKYSSLEGKDLLAWARNRAKFFGVEIEDQALSGLAMALAGQLGRLSSEIEKLSLLHPEGGQVSDREIEEVLGPSVWEPAKKITQAIGNGRFKEALQAWEEQRLWGERPENILSSLFYEVVNRPGAEENLEALYQADVTLKSGAAPEAVIMPLVITRIVHPAFRIKEEKPVWLK
jgi:DNA polymerase-3 subunit delta